MALTGYIIDNLSIKKNENAFIYNTVTIKESIIQWQY